MTSKENLLKQTEGKKSEVLNLPPTMRERIIQNAREKIVHLEASKGKLLPTWQEKKEYFELIQKEWLEVKAQMDNFNEEVEQQEILIKSIAGSKDKSLQVVREKERREGTKAPKRVSWTDEAAKVLEFERKFMSPEEIFNKIIIKPEVLDLLEESITWKKNKALTRHSFIRDLIKHADKVRRGDYSAGSRLFKPLFTIYQDMIGMSDWINHEGVPKDPKLMKQFMFRA